MLPNLFSKSQQSIGIDLDGINIAVLRKKRGETKVLHAASGNFNSDQQKIKFLRNFFTQRKIRNKNIYTAIPARHTIKKELQFDIILQDIDIKLQLELEQKRYFPGITEKLAFDFIIKNTTKEKQNVIVYATKQQVLIDKLGLLRAVKLYPACVETDSFAWLRLLDSTQKKKLVENRAGVLLVVQHEILRIMIFNHNEILYENNEFTQNDVIIFVQRNLNHFAAANFHYKLTAFYLIGKKTLAEQLQQEIKFKITHVMPVAEIDEKLLLAYGLALRGFDDND